MNTQERRSRQHYSPELKLKLVKMALKAGEDGGSVAAIAREYGVNDNLLFKWMRLWQSEGRVSRPRRPYRKTYSPALLPVRITSPQPDSPPVTVPARSPEPLCHARLRHGDITLHNPSPELLSLLLWEMMAGVRFLNSICPVCSGLNRAALSLSRIYAEAVSWACMARRRKSE